METRKVNVMGKEMQIPKGMTFGELAKEFEGEVFGKILVAKQGNSLRELICPIRTDEDITFLDFRDKEGVRVYERGISLLLVKAVRDVLGTATGVEIEHSLRGNLYCELRSPQQVPDADLLAKIEARMKEYVAADTPIVKHVCPREVAISIVKEQGLQDKVELFRYRTASNINLYELDGFYDYFFGYMPDSVGALEWFTLMPFETGFLVRFPDPAKTGELLPEEQPRKISKVFLEQMHWCQLMQVRNVAELNRTIVEGKFGDLIRVNEALHEKKIAEIADQIHQRMDKVRVVLIAGPSSSGKTTTANLLVSDLSALGRRAVRISLDDFYRNRDVMPLWEDGTKNFESIEGLDLECFSTSVNTLMREGHAEFPIFDFSAGKRSPLSRPMEYDENTILIFEGIPALQPQLRQGLASSNFGIYIHPNTSYVDQDGHTLLDARDLRLTRRIIRDNLHRGTPPLGTMQMWKDVLRGELLYMKPSSGTADVFVNTSHDYEPFLYAAVITGLLEQIEDAGENRETVERLLESYRHFFPIGTELVPPSSLIQEFIGDK